MNEDKIVWQSKHYPQLVLSQAKLDLLKYAYPSIKKFEPLLKDMEVWLFDHPEKQPKRNWGAFISSWCRIHVRIEAERQAERRPEQGDAARRTPGDAKVVGEILRRAME